MPLPVVFSSRTSSILLRPARRTGRKRIEEILLEKTTGGGIRETPDQTSAAA